MNHFAAIRPRRCANVARYAPAIRRRSDIRLPSSSSTIARYSSSRPTGTIAPTWAMCASSRSATIWRMTPSR